MAVRIVKHAFEIIHLLTDSNPIQILVDAIVNCGVREDSTRIGSSGTVRRQAVDVSPLRRVNQAIGLVTVGAREAAFRNIKTISECLAEELINAAKVRIFVPVMCISLTLLGIIQLLRYQEEGRARACCQVQPISSIFISAFQPSLWRTVRERMLYTCLRVSATNHCILMTS